MNMYQVAEAVMALERMWHGAVEHLTNGQSPYDMPEYKAWQTMLRLYSHMYMHMGDAVE